MLTQRFEDTNHYLLGLISLGLLCRNACHTEFTNFVELTGLIEAG